LLFKSGKGGMKVVRNICAWGGLRGGGGGGGGGGVTFALFLFSSHPGPLDLPCIHFLPYR